MNGKSFFVQVLDDGEDVVALRARHDAEAELVVDLRGDRLLLREELRVERVLVLPPADELGDREAVREHAPDDAVDLLLDDVEDLLVGEREHEEELASLEVMDDVHALQDRARAHLPVTAPDASAMSSSTRRLLDRLRDRVLEVAAQVADGLVLDSAPSARGRRARRAELLRAEEVADLFVGLEVQPVPVDDRVAAKDEADGFEIGERELVQSFETLGRIAGFYGHARAIHVREATSFRALGKGSRPRSCGMASATALASQGFSSSVVTPLADPAE